MFKQYDFFLLLAVVISFVTSAWFWFSGFQLEGIFTALWVPSILAFGIYFKLTVLLRKHLR
ncbi:MAG: hypothetical protein CMF48_00025 [Legionellales bacterium]|nr:hypothetical protein [Legionellales bacterium]